MATSVSSIISTTLPMHQYPNNGPKATMASLYEVRRAIATPDPTVSIDLDSHILNSSLSKFTGLGQNFDMKV